MSQVNIGIGSLGWQLEELECAALLTAQEEGAEGETTEGELVGAPKEVCTGHKPLIEELEQTDDNSTSSEWESSSELSDSSDSSCTGTSSAGEDEEKT